MNRNVHSPREPDDNGNLSLSDGKKSSAEIRRAQTGVRGAIKTLGAYGVIMLGSIAGGRVAGEQGAKIVHHGIEPIITAINDLVTPKMCREEFEGFKGVVLDEMNGRIGKMLNSVLDSVDMKKKIQGWLNGINATMNSLREDMCRGLKKIPELTAEIDLEIQAYTKIIVRWMTTAILLLSLSMIYHGKRRRTLRKLADDALMEIEDELQKTKQERRDLKSGNARLEKKVKNMEEILKNHGMMPGDTTHPDTDND